MIRRHTHLSSLLVEYAEHANGRTTWYGIGDRGDGLGSLKRGLLGCGGKRCEQGRKERKNEIRCACVERMNARGAKHE